MEKKKLWIILGVVAVAAGLTYGMPRAKYKSPDVISKLDIPYRMIGWQGKTLDMSGQLTDERYNFISRIFSRRYVNSLGEPVVFTILDAGNFHNPKVCLGGSGFTSRDLPETEFKAGNKTFKATTVYFEKPGEGYLVIYWISINKKLVDWNQQKLLQLVSSIFNKEKVGLLVRFDIPCRKEQIPRAAELAQTFISDLAPKLSTEDSEYLFGR